MKIQSFKFTNSNSANKPGIKLTNDMRSCNIEIKGMRGFDFSFQIVCEKSEFYFPSVTASSSNYFLTDPKHSNQQISLIDFLKTHEENCAEIKLFLTTLTNSLNQNTAEDSESSLDSDSNLSCSM